MRIKICPSPPVPMQKNRLWATILAQISPLDNLNTPCQGFFGLWVTSVLSAMQVIHQQSKGLVLTQQDSHKCCVSTRTFQHQIVQERFALLYYAYMYKVLCISPVHWTLYGSFMMESSQIERVTVSPPGWIPYNN